MITPPFKLPMGKPHNDVPRTDIGFGERICADKECRKQFLITCPINKYVYKIKVNHRNPEFFCCYTHYNKALNARDNEKSSNRRAYTERRKKGQ